MSSLITIFQQVEKKADLYYNSPIADKANGLFAPTLGTICIAVKV